MASRPGTLFWQGRQIMDWYQKGHRMNILAKWGLLSQAERDAAYNNSAHVPDSPVLNAAREVASSAFRTTNPLHLDLRYGKRERNTWDLFPAIRPRCALHRFHPWRLLAA